MKYFLYAIFSTPDGSPIFEQDENNMVIPSNQSKNLGDYVQALAALRFLPRCDGFIGRDELCSYKGKDEICVIGNAWYRLKDEHHNINEKIHLLPISMHVEGRDISSARAVLSKLRKIGNSSNIGIGCRDYHTKELFERHGIKAYFSSCLTTTIDLKIIEEKLKQINSDFFNDYNETSEYKKIKAKLIDIENTVTNTDYIVFADFNFSNLRNCDWLMYPDYYPYRNLYKMQNLLNEVFDAYKGYNSVYLTHTISNKLYPVEFLDVAYQVLRIYNKAKLVLTTRLHVALPCLAISTPVICINNNFGPRMTSFKDMLNHIEINNFNYQINKDNGKVTNSNNYIEYANQLVDTCNKFINIMNKK